MEPVEGSHEHSDYIGAKIGMWLFLFTEVLLFGGLFLCYAVYRHRYAQDFHSAAHELNAVLGCVNTLVLLTSSLTMALAISALQKNRPGLSRFYLWATIGCAVIFLGIKYVEWGAKIHHGIYPGSEHLMANFNPGERLFFGLYFSMTGLHGLHVIIGGIVLLCVERIVAKLPRGEDPGESGTVTIIENAGLYWHLVDIIWVYLFPLYYLLT
ncbi:MAG: cytochrome c oxidase subunit 3 family protein [Candidatus Hydrogenedentota bacterium]|nr:MAG: cytochrome c oxidase subunit 3 family protein [Candidatus Hydrogenedentota bacterium]